MDAGTCPWTCEQHDLWRRVQAHAFEDPSVGLDFTRRLARTMAWPVETARTGIAEYRRFCFLAAISTTPVTPSEQVDEIWHLHLTYTRDYWNGWCGTALGKTLHHDPTAGGDYEQAKFRIQYAETLALYERYFGPPDATFWPGLRERFRPTARYRLVDCDKRLVLPRLSVMAARIPGLAVFLGLISGTPAAAAVTIPDVLDWQSGPFLELYGLLLVFGFALAFVLRSILSETGQPVDSRNLSTLQVAYLGGGMRRAADALVLDLATRGALNRLNGPGIVISAERRDLPASLEPFRSLEPGAYSRFKLSRILAASPEAAAMRDDLVSRNMCQDSRRQILSILSTLAPVVPVLVLGVAKMVRGISHHRPIGFLVMLVLIATALLVRLLLSNTWITAEGGQALERLRDSNDRVVRAPRPFELPFAYALAGASALSGTYAAYATLLTSGQGSKDTDGSGCGASGGGGCGGCGS